MKKLMLVLLLALSVVANAEIFLEFNKEVNGSYKIKLPAYKTTVKSFTGVIYEPEVALIFTQRRGGNILQPNHYSTYTNHNFGYSFFFVRDDDPETFLLGFERKTIQDVEFFCTYSIGAEYIFEGNDDNKDEGVYWFNILRFGVR